MVAYERLTRKLTKENLWLYILRMLLERPMYAYEINKVLKERFGFSTATVTVYVVLYKMLRDGLIRLSGEESVLGRPDRKYYQATESGVESLKKGTNFLRETLKRLS